VTLLDEAHPPGTILDVAVTEVIDDYDFRAASLGTALRATTVDRERRLPLPLAGEPVSMGSYGR
jgi:hypothetical protein